MQDAADLAFSRIAGHKIATLCAGRTDAGAHALAQVIHFDTEAERPISAWVRGVNAFLPDAVAVIWAQRVPIDFHARFNAIERSYRYVLCNRPPRPALERQRAGWYHRPLDIAAMNIAARVLIGKHDFSAFRAAGCQARSPVREMRSIQIERHRDYVIFNFSADAFLHHMVRNIVGSLVYVGAGKHGPDWLGEVLNDRDRTRAAPTFSPVGLYLANVRYDASWGLPSFPVCGFFGNFGAGQRDPRKD